jgi:3-oxoadipate enol-lactonase
MESYTVRLPQGIFRWLEAGQGRPVVLVHAFPLGADQWIPQLSAPPPGVRVIAPDLRGFGGSVTAASDAPTSMATYASDIFDLMTHLRVPAATLVGLSMGGYVALAMAALQPGRVSGLVLADTRATADGPEARSARDRMVERVRRDGPAGVATDMLSKLLGETTRRNRPELGGHVRALIEANGPEGIEAAILAMKGRADHSAALGAFRFPATVVCGAEDVITPPSECEAMSHQIPGARFIRIDGAGHLTNLEAPQAFNAALA